MNNEKYPCSVVVYDQHHRCICQETIVWHYNGISNEIKIRHVDLTKLDLEIKDVGYPTANTLFPGDIYTTEMVYTGEIDGEKVKFCLPYSEQDEKEWLEANGKNNPETKQKSFLQRVSLIKHLVKYFRA